jgi:hypothetical protein
MNVIKIEPSNLEEGMVVVTIEGYPYQQPTFLATDVDTEEKLQSKLSEWKIQQDYCTNVNNSSIQPDPVFEENLYQNNKSPMLKQVENLYIDFLTNDWTPLLRKYGLIPISHTITVDNTDSYTNMGLLMQLRAINKTEYYNMAGEFDRFKNTIEGLGGIMAKVVLHKN